MNMNRLNFPLALTGIMVGMLAMAAEGNAPAPAVAALPPASVPASEAELAAVAAHVHVRLD